MTVKERAFLSSCGRERSGLSGASPGLPHKNGEWLFPFTLPQIHRHTEDIVLDILKAGWGMEGPQAEMSLPWDFRPEFCCHNYKFQVEIILSTTGGQN